MILDYIEKGNTITALEALQMFGCFRLAARVNQLKRQGHNVSQNMITVINQEGKTVRVAEYRLVKQ